MSAVPSPGRPSLRIGELSRRVGVSAEALRAWQQRYGVLRPERSPAGYRLYGPDDERRARRMKELIDEGHAAAEAARALAGGLDVAPAPPPAGEMLAAARSGFRDALLAFDAATAHEGFDRLLAAHSLDVVLRDVVLPVLHEIGRGWERGEISIAQEHFSAELLAGRLRGLGRGWDEGLGPRVVLACPGGERHDLGLLCCALALHERGWRVTYLGADTPQHALEDAVAGVEPALVVLSAVTSDPLYRVAGALARLGTSVAVGGEGAVPLVAERAAARRLTSDPVSGARELTLAHAD